MQNQKEKNAAAYFLNCKAISFERHGKDRTQEQQTIVVESVIHWFIISDLHFLLSNRKTVIYWSFHWYSSNSKHLHQLWVRNLCAFRMGPWLLKIILIFPEYFLSLSDLFSYWSFFKSSPGRNLTQPVSQTTPLIIFCLWSNHNCICFHLDPFASIVSEIHSRYVAPAMPTLWYFAKSSNT